MRPAIPQTNREWPIPWRVTRKRTSIVIPPMTHVGTIIHISGGPPGRKVDITPLTNWVKVAAPVFPTISLAIRTKMVPAGTAITAYKPGRGAGIKAVVNVASEDKHPKRHISAKFLEVKKRSSIPHLTIKVYFSVRYPLPICLFHPGRSVLLWHSPYRQLCLPSILPLSP
jgi:hypothetical protein